MQSLSGLINSEVPVISCYHLIKLRKDIEISLYGKEMILALSSCHESESFVYFNLVQLDNNIIVMSDYVFSSFVFVTA